MPTPPTHPPSRPRAGDLPLRRVALALTLLAGCPEPDKGPCAGGTLAVTARPNRLDTAEITDGAEIPVFPPPQGGVFTELDVSIAGTASDDLDVLRVQIDDAAGTPLARQVYNGSGLPLLCGADDRLVVFDLPVAFDASVVLADLDAQPATLRLGIDAAAGTVDTQWSVVLRVTD